MGKKKNRSSMKWSINDKVAKDALILINEHMQKIRSLIGNTGDGVNGLKATLIGAVEGLNNDAKDGQVLTNAYNKFNNTTMANIGKALRSIDSNIAAISGLIGGRASSTATFTLGSALSSGTSSRGSNSRGSNSRGSGSGGSSNRTNTARGSSGVAATERSKGINYKNGGSNVSNSKPKTTTPTGGGGSKGTTYKGGSTAGMPSSDYNKARAAAEKRFDNNDPFFNAVSNTVSGAKKAGSFVGGQVKAGFTSSK